LKSDYSVTDNDNEKKSSVELSERAQILLKTLVSKYIDEGLPVGSKALVAESGLDLSSATIRNVLSDLESLGLIRSPHKSAGRVPTDLGYRLFVDSLVTVENYQEAEMAKMKQQLSSQPSTKDIAFSASDLLSGMTNMASLVMLPRRSDNSLRHIEFLPLSENRILSIVVVNESEVENRIIYTKRPYERHELEQIGNFLTARFAGKNLQSVRSNLLREMKQAKFEINSLMESLLEMADQLFPEEKSNEDLLVTGKTNLFTHQEMGDTEKLKQLFDAFKHQKDVLEILDQCLIAQNTQIYIGSETGNDLLESCSIVTSPYTVEGKVIGFLGVIGPTRMAYNKIIPAVDITAKLFGSVLEFKQ